MIYSCDICSGFLFAGLERDLKTCISRYPPKKTIFIVPETLWKPVLKDPCYGNLCYGYDSAHFVQKIISLGIYLKTVVFYWPAHLENLQRQSVDDELKISLCRVKYSILILRSRYYEIRYLMWTMQLIVLSIHRILYLFSTIMLNIDFSFSAFPLIFVSVLKSCQQLFKSFLYLLISSLNII